MFSAAGPVTGRDDCLPLLDPNHRAGGVGVLDARLHRHVDLNDYLRTWSDDLTPLLAGSKPVEEHPAYDNTTAKAVALDLHGWAFDRFTSILGYKAKAEGIDVVEVSERDTSKTCCVCGREEDSQRVERGLYVREDSDAAFNADVNRVENIRLNINEESNSESTPSLGWDGVPAGWHSLEYPFTTSPEDSNLGQRWSTPNPNIPPSGFLRLQAEEDVN